MTVGMPARNASSTGRRSALLSRGDSTSPETPWLMKPSTTCSCCSRSSSRIGPFQMTSTRVPAARNSAAAFSAPIFTRFQCSWVDPLGMTPIVITAGVGVSLPPQPATVISAATAVTTNPILTSLRSLRLSHAPRRRSSQNGTHSCCRDARFPAVDCGLRCRTSLCVLPGVLTRAGMPSPGSGIGFWSLFDHRPHHHHAPAISAACRAPG